MTNEAESDSKFVSILLSAVFGDEILMGSSAGGRKSNYNNVSHKALDAIKLKFIKGCFFYYQKLLLCSYLSFESHHFRKQAILLLTYPITDVFDERVLDDEKRKNQSTKFVNKKCNNLRRGGKKKE